MHRIGLLALPGTFPLEHGAAEQIFAAEPGYELIRCAPVSTSTGNTNVSSAAALTALTTVDTVIVPGYENVAAPLSTEVVAALRDAHARGARMVSFCSGAFALAAAGLLDDRPATTHWQNVDELRRRYPRIDVQPDRLYVDDGDVLTSAGVTACIDLCLHLIRTDHGAAAANDRARALVAPPRRTGGQLQYIDQVRPRTIGQELEALRTWMTDHLNDELTVDELAARAHMSRRTLTRRFRAETGTSPMSWLTAARIDRARELLETTDEPIEAIGEHVGLDAPASFRNAFHRNLGTSPQQYRAIFRRSGPYPR